MPCHKKKRLFHLLAPVTHGEAAAKVATKRNPERSEDWNCRRCLIDADRRGTFACAGPVWCLFTLGGAVDQ
jgi:hypothetical protein